MLSVRITLLFRRRHQKTMVEDCKLLNAQYSKYMTFILSSRYYIVDGFILFLPPVALSLILQYSLVPSWAQSLPSVADIWRPVSRQNAMGNKHMEFSHQARSSLKYKQLKREVSWSAFPSFPVTLTQDTSTGGQTTAQAYYPSHMG